MSSSEQALSTSNRSIEKSLLKKGIKKVAFIDDVFDMPSMEDFVLSDLQNFWEEADIADIAEASDELISLGITARSADEFDNDALQKLWKNRDKLKVLNTSCDNLFQEKIRELDRLNRICSFFKDLNVEQVCLGSNDVLGDKSINLFFIDYYLGPTSDLAKEKSRSKAKEIYKLYENGTDKPLIILMSSNPGAEAYKEEFIEQTSILGGMFDFASKDELSVKAKLLLKLYAWSISFETGHKVQHFVNTLLKAANKVSEQFSKDAMALSLGDYAYIQKLSLQGDGHPLGDYMSWLYGEHFVGLLFHELKEQRKRINDLAFNELPSNQLYPSKFLKEIYQSAIFEPAETRLSLGDIYIINDTEVGMIINAQCDLASMRRDGEAFDILLLHGKLYGHTETIKDSGPKARTEFFEYNKDGEKKSFRILWDLRRVETINSEKFDKEITEKGYLKCCRLKLIFALEIQNKFASSMTRVGLPVAPPIYSPVKLELFCEGDSGKTERLIDLKSGLGYLFFTKKKDLCILRDEFLFEFKERLPKAIELLETQTGSADVKKKELLNRKKNNLEVLLSNDIKFYQFRDPIQLPNLGGISSFKNAIYVVRNRMNLEDEKFRFDEHALLLNVIDES